ncbi:type I polyketide synthase [Frankia sp. Cppng1_Ct_nod]|uniref:type I polyketide synthase n=1 Tax=Frankia sp. Cppng1_Ct_nod TaxID=2897162 RepID=UPI002023DC1A|nr:type I polyketide synthase [Frankia sp. Cppng1_Ct_nod]
MKEVAIVGLAARFPGAADTGAFWRLLQDARSQFREVPASRWRHRSFYDPVNPRDPHRTYTDQVAFIDDVERFAASHYRIPPQRARAMDPQHRLLVDLTREALQDAGFERRPFDRTRTGVYVGISQSGYHDLTGTRIRGTLLADGSLHGGEPDPELLAAVERAADLSIAPLQAYSLAGCLLNMAAGTVSSVFDLGGPAFAVDAACSSTLVALHEAVLGLRSGVCRVALVGGVFLTLGPDALVGFSRVGALSRSGVCRPFDERADGFVLGEGGGVAVLRPMADALADGDRVYAVIRGIGVTNDGRAAGPMTPSASGQLAALRAAYADAEVSPGSVTMIEAHGTATTVGDQIEITALRDLRADDPDAEPCALTSAKALIGHTLAAAGAAGLLKTALALHHGVIPPQPAVQPRTGLAMPESGLRIPTQPQAWPDSKHPRRGAVSSFGFGGTNVHVVLERVAERGEPDMTPERPWLVMLSAGSAELLTRHTEAIRDTVDADPGLTPASVAYTLATREPLTARLCVVAASRAQLIERLTDAATRLRTGRFGALPGGGYVVATPLAEADRRVAWLFPGQGVQRPGMLADLRERFTGFARQVDTLDGVARPVLGRSLVELVWGAHPDTAAAQAALTATQICQPVLGALGIGVARLLAQCGVRPDVCIGHSAGEVAAAMAAGALDPADALRFLAARGAAVADAHPPWTGGMLAVHAGESTFHRLAGDIDGVWLGCVNHPSQVVASGRLDALERLRERCEREGVTARPLTVSHPFHSPLVAGADISMAGPLAALPLRAFEAVVASSVSGGRCDDPRELRALWAEHCSAPVRFSDAIRTAAAAGARIFVQVFGGTSLLTMARGSLSESIRGSFVALAAPEPDEGHTLLAGLGRLACLGVHVDILPLFGPGERTLTTLPPSPLVTSSYSVRLATGRTAAQPGGPAVRPDHRRGVPTRRLPELRMDSPRPDSHPMDDIVRLLDKQLNLLHALAAPATGSDPNDDGIGITGMSTSRRPDPTSVRLGTPMVVPAPPTQRQPVEPDRVVRRPAVVTADAGSPPARLVGLRAATIEVISRLSALPAGCLHDDHAFVGDLGFDSIMMTDLVNNLRRRWPELVVHTDDIARVTTVGDLVGVLAGKSGLAEVAGPTDPPPGLSEPSQSGTDHSVDAAASVPSEHVHPEQARPAVESTQVASFPEVVALRERLELSGRLGLRSPYYLLHEGNIRDRTVVDGRELVSFSTYNYLGLSGHPEVNSAVTAAVRRYGSSVSAARILSGDRPPHRDLEAELAALVGVEDCIVLVSGHATNVTAIGHLVGPGDLIVHDALAHDSILQGARLSGATRRPFPHNDPTALDALLTQVRDRFRRVLIVVEGVYSMDGDIADLPALIQVRRRHGALLMVDEAHSIGVIGATGGGVGEYFGVDRGDVDLWMGTLSKSLASCGGYLAGSGALVDYLRYTLPGFIYSAGLTPPNTAAALTALRVMRAEPDRLTRLRQRSAEFLRLAREAGVNTGTSAGTPVIPCIVGDSLRCVHLANTLFERGISVNPILYPAVEERLSRLRFFITGEHTSEQIERTVQLLADELDTLVPQQLVEVQ